MPHKTIIKNSICFKVDVAIAIIIWCFSNCGSTLFPPFNVAYFYYVKYPFKYLINV